MDKKAIITSFVILFILSACGKAVVYEPSQTSSSEPSPVPSNTPMPTATQTATPTHTPSPTPVPPTATPTMSPEEIAALRLYEASLYYVAETPLEANDKVKEIGFLDGTYESPDNACGPLTAAIMRDGGFLPEDSPVKDMWLLCMREDEEDEDLPFCHGTRTLNRIYFPPEKYDYIKIEESIGKFDFVSNPLQVGDWLYLYVLKGVSNFTGFDHMLVVTRVDENGAAYSVTNINHGEGFVIKEEMLYDPTRPGVGLFYDLSNDDLRKELGMTGTAGFLLIRAKNAP